MFDAGSALELTKVVKCGLGLAPRIRVQYHYELTYSLNSYLCGGDFGLVN